MTPINAAPNPATPFVSYRLDDRGVAFVTLERPDKHNAFDDTIIAELRRRFDMIAKNSSIRAMVLQATGRSFSAGGDLAWMQRMANYNYAENLSDAQELARMLFALRNLPQPTIARIQGSAFAGAVGLICCCDIAIATASARFGLTETRIGLLPATISPYVIEAIGARWARRLFITGEHFDAAVAQAIHLVHEVCEAEALDERIEQQLTQLLQNGPQAMRESKKLVADFQGRVVGEDVMNDTSARIAALRVSTEGQEGLAAFLEKRPAQWTQGDSN